MKKLEDGKAEKDIATITADGLLSAADKVKLNNIDDNANKYTLPAGAWRIRWSINSLAWSL